MLEEGCSCPDNTGAKEDRFAAGRNFASAAQSFSGSLEEMVFGQVSR